jgi:hypothetical protein
LSVLFDDAPAARRSVHFSSAEMSWATPRHVYEELDREFHFTLDPCPLGGESELGQDGLLMPWSGQTVFLNPPYGRELPLWIRKAYVESNVALNAATVVCLIPSRTDTAWWHDFCMRAEEIRFIRGRLKFGGAVHSAPFPSAIVVFRGAA